MNIKNYIKSLTNMYKYQGRFLFFLKLQALLFKVKY